MRRILAPFLVLLAPAAIFGATLAVGADSPRAEHIQVTPTAGSARTVFELSVRVPKRTGAFGSIQRHDVLTASAPADAGGCVTTVDVRIPDSRAGARVHIALSPREQGGHWCQGTYRGRIEELQSAACRRGELCPNYVLVRGIVGRFALHVQSTASGENTPPPPSTDTTPPSFAGLQGAFACTPGPQRPGQTTPFTLSWQAATDDVTPSSQILYEVYLASKPGGEDFSAPTWTTASGATSFQTPGMPSHGTFYFVVRARDAAGNEDRNTVERLGSDPCL